MRKDDLIGWFRRISSVMQNKKRETRKALFGGLLVKAGV